MPPKSKELPRGPAFPIDVLTKREGRKNLKSISWTCFMLGQLIPMERQDAKSSDYAYCKLRELHRSPE
jgi:hypothetical protein